MLWQTPMLLRFFFSLSALGLVAPFAQQPFAFPNPHVAQEEYYELKWPIRKVAIIGAGVGGLLSYREFINAGFEAHIFERDDAPGGNWHYTEETPVDAPIPNVDVVIGDYEPELAPLGVNLPYTKELSGKAFHSSKRAHRGPKPVWASLTSNAPAPWQQITDWPWPKGAPWELPHGHLQRYLRSFASFHGLNSNDGHPDVSYNTRVELVEKDYDADGAENGWNLSLTKLVQTGENTGEITYFTEHFDAVVVATGRFNAPYIPNIPGLAEWNARFPDSISHSRQYRTPQSYAGETVLMVGAATSGGEISRDINPHAKKIYQSVRPDNSTVPHFQLTNFLRRLPANTTVVGEIKRFHPPTGNFSEGQVELTNGTILTGIDRIIFATGFRYSFPFLPHYHNSSIGLNETAPDGSLQPLVTDGTHIRSLHLDLFFIEEPTIGFINMNLGMQSFTYAEYLSLALAKVWSNTANLPSTPELWRLYNERVEEFGGYGRHFQFLGSERTEVLIRYFIAWLNSAAVKYGGRQIDGIPKENEAIRALWSVLRFGRDVYDGREGDDTNSTMAFCTACTTDLNGLSQNQLWDQVVNDFW